MTTRVRLTVTVEVDPAEWAAEYNEDMSPAEVRDDMRAYFRQRISDLAAIDVGPDCDRPVTPNTPGTTRRSFRIPDDEYDPAKVKATERGETVTDVVRRAVMDYVVIANFTEAQRRDGIWTMTDTEFRAELAKAWDEGLEAARLASILGVKASRNPYVEEET